MEASLLAVLRKPRRISSIEVTKLHIFVPPRRKDDAGKDAASALAGKLRGPSPVIVGRITTDDTLLEIGSSKPGRDPRQFEIRKLTLTDAAFDRPTAYQATLTNPVPKGLIESRGTFGPWQPDDPTLTPLTGTYTFNADLNSIKGLGGHLAFNRHLRGPPRADHREGHHQHARFLPRYRRPAGAAHHGVHGHRGWHQRRHGPGLREGDDRPDPP